MSKVLLNVLITVAIWLSVISFIGLLCKFPWIILVLVFAYLFVASYVAVAEVRK